MKTEASEYLSLLQEIQNNNVSTFTVMPADEPRFTIETNSRNIIVPSEFSFLSVQNDHRAETIYFEIDRYFDNVDLSQHACVVQFINKSGTTINEGTYPVTSMDIDSVDGKIVFGWEIRNDATQLTGDITFSVRFYSIDNNGNFTYNFNTLTASSYILPSLNIIASGERITATELEVWTDKMNNLASSIESDIITVEEKIEELENYIASIPEDYTALTEEVSQLSSENAELKGDLDDVNTIAVNGENVYFYQEHPKSNYYTEKVNLKANQTYTIHVDSSRDCSVTTRDKDDNRTEIVAIWGEETKEFTPQTNITELILWIDDEETPTSQTFIVKIYRGKIKDEINKLEKKINDVGERTIYVEKDGTCDFTSLVDAVNYVNSNTSIKFTVYVGSGTYDLIEELGEEYFADYKGVGLVLNNNAHYIFSSNSKVVCNYVGDNENIKKYFSPFNCSVDGDHTGFILENLTLECANVRYAIHDEVNGQIAPFKNEYINCHITLDNSQNTKGYRQCIGGGLGCASEVIIKNCYFKSIGASNTEIVTYHNVNSSSNDNYRSNVTIDSCYFADTNSCRCSYCGISEKISRMIVSNCSLGAEPRMIAETSSALVNFELIKWNNEIRI